MVQLFAGLVVLLALMMLARWFTTATPQSVIRTARWTGAALLVGSGALLLFTGRAAWAFAALAGLVPWAIRAIHMHNLYGLVRRGLGRRAAGEGASNVRTRFLEMTLEHDSGTIIGRVVEGPFRGRLLSQLSFDEALELLRQCSADAPSAQLLEAWLDRTWPDWRERPAQEEAPPHGASGAAMGHDEAFEVLGLEPGASPAEIKAAHRRLMGFLHPDHGGSNYLAAKINQAKDLLLKD